MEELAFNTPVIISHRTRDGSHQALRSGIQLQMRQWHLSTVFIIYIFKYVFAFKTEEHFTYSWRARHYLRSDVILCEGVRIRQICKQVRRSRMASGWREGLVLKTIKYGRAHLTHLLMAMMLKSETMGTMSNSDNDMMPKSSIEESFTFLLIIHNNIILL